MAQGFVILTDPWATEYRTFAIASQAYTIGDLVDISRTTPVNGVCGAVPSTASSTTIGIRGIAMETKLSTDTTLLVALVTHYQKIGADTTNAANIAHCGQRMIIGATARLVNNTGTD